jgi:hypothetical protein
MFCVLFCFSLSPLSPSLLLFAQAITRAMEAREGDPAELRASAAEVQSVIDKIPEGEDTAASDDDDEDDEEELGDDDDDDDDDDDGRAGAGGGMDVE